MKLEENPVKRERSLQEFWLHETFAETQASAGPIAVARDVNRLPGALDDTRIFAMLCALSFAAYLLFSNTTSYFLIRLFKPLFG